MLKRSAQGMFVGRIKELSDDRNLLKEVSHLDLASDYVPLVHLFFQHEGYTNHECFSMGVDYHRVHRIR